MDAIARQADVSKATVYAHFAGKEALFIAVMGMLREAYQEKLANIALMEGDGFAYRLKLALTAMLEFMMQSNTLQMFRILIAETHRFPEIALHDLRTGRERSERLLGDIFTKGVEEGAIAPLDCKQAAHFVMAMLKGGLLWGKLVDASLDVSEQDMRNAVDTVIATVLQLHKPSTH
jgi:AcrR family transcriptional regulator